MYIFIIYFIYFIYFIYIQKTKKIKGKIANFGETIEGVIVDQTGKRRNADGYQKIQGNNLGNSKKYLDHSEGNRGYEKIVGGKKQDY